MHPIEDLPDFCHILDSIEKGRVAERSEVDELRASAGHHGETRGGQGNRLWRRVLQVRVLIRRGLQAIAVSAFG